MSDILETIAAYKREDVRTRMEQRSASEMEALAWAATPVRGFASSLRRPRAPGRPALIAEIKKASPSRGLIRADFDPSGLARAYADGGATCLSVLTDGPSFQGADAFLQIARAAVDLPCLRKDFLVDPWQVAESRALGADAILIIMAMVDDRLASSLMAEADRFAMDALVECHDEREVDRALGIGARLLGINNRNLRTFEVDLATSESLARHAPSHVLLVSESGIFTPADVQRVSGCGAGAILVGESLMREADVALATRALLA